MNPRPSGTLSQSDINITVGTVNATDSRVAGGTIQRGATHANLQIQPVVWLQDENGVEHTFEGGSFSEARPGQKMVVVCKRSDGKLLRVYNAAGRHMVRVKNGKLRIEYTRGKTGVRADLPVIPELAAELARLPPEQILFLPQKGLREPYKVTSFGNWFRDRCREAGVSGSIHGLRKAGATRLADAGASDWEIASYLAHTDTTQASIYTREANRSKLADSGFEKLHNLSNTPEELDGEED